MSRLPYYTKFWLKYLTKTFDDRIPDEKYFEVHKPEIDYYCKIDQPISLQKGIKVRDINLLKNSGYTNDLYAILYPFREELIFNFIPGDVTTVPEYPAFVKSRPIEGQNDNSVLLPLDSQRHFRFVKDEISYAKKTEGIVWRGAAHQEHRLNFLKTCSQMNFINAGNTAVSKEGTIPFAKPKMSINQQLKYKFILSLEGNDVATNLKWIMSSNSVCIMPRPKFETWYMEGTLIPNYHYIEINDDFSDLEEVFNYFLKRPIECSTIVRNANKYTERFKDNSSNLILSRMVVSKYHKYVRD